MVEVQILAEISRCTKLNDNLSAFFGADYADFTDNLFTVKRWTPLIIQMPKLNSYL